MANVNRRTSARTGLPTTSQLENELNREKYRRRYSSTLRSTIYILITVAAAAVLLATQVFPIFRIYGTSMQPTLEQGDLVVAINTSKVKQGDLIAFYYSGKLLVKRVIATENDWVNIDRDGNVFVNNILIDEPYLTSQAFGECDIDLPYQVPEKSIFVMGDHRETSRDSRSKEIGAISLNECAGKLLLRIWPYKQLRKF
ncbi:MAG: signal peptidase I [Solobacterium sp.]|nr:signal peptidase I [Solobacterium sp.]